MNVTLDCDDAFLKNDKGVRVENDNWNVENYPTNEPVYSHELVASGYFTLYNYVHPFSVGNNATVNFTGKLFVDTFSDKNYVSMFDDYRDTPNNIYGIYYNLNGSSLGKKFFVSGTEYDLSDYAVDFHCIKNIENNSSGIYTFRDNWLDAYIYTHHNIPEGSDTCTQCGLQFDGIYTVTVDDAINTPTAYRVAKGDTFDRPADPAASAVPVGRKFSGWYVDETTEYDFNTPVTSDITLTAHYEDRLISGVALSKSPTTTEYIEGNTFDPAGLEIT
ncbi:MAG: InlB B-repeat-containing protein [Oscillospiraceae bacterium]